MTKLQRRELELVTELQDKHGYLFAEMPKSDRHTMLFRRNRATGKHTLTPARKVVLVAPDTSWIANQFNEHAKRKQARRKARKP